MGVKIQTKNSEKSFDGSRQESAGFQKIALVGNPNVGKSVIFNALTGLSADVSNYPGTTIDIASGLMGSGGDHLCDTPGVYGVSSMNDEEKTARSLILEADVLVNVVSALSLDRDLFLTLQLMDMGKPMILVINQWDEALNHGIEIDLEKFSQYFDFPVLTCVAVEGKGLEKIEPALEKACPGRSSSELEEMLGPVMEAGLPRPAALLARVPQGRGAARGVGRRKVPGDARRHLR